MSGPSPEAIQRVWTASLAIYAVVVVVVVVLLTLILRTARRIQDGAAEIWNVGQKVANNTIHIALLDTTNHVVGRILRSAVGVVSATGALKDHAAACPHCPSCVTGGR